MSELQFTVGASVTCSDGPCGELRRIIVDPATTTVTHLVVGSDDGDVGERLVPVDLVDTTASVLTLTINRADVAQLESADGEARLAAPPELVERQAMSDTLFVGAGGIAVGTVPMLSALTLRPLEETVAYDRVPRNEVEIQPGDTVHATDGPIGRVEGLVTDPSDFSVTHILLAAGHLWGKKEVAIPISAVTSVENAGYTQLTLSKDEVRDLPPVAIERH
jgi:hypothetical protein